METLTCIYFEEIRLLNRISKGSIYSGVQRNSNSYSKQGLIGSLSLGHRLGFWLCKYLEDLLLFSSFISVLKILSYMLSKIHDKKAIDINAKELSGEQGKKTIHLHIWRFLWPLYWTSPPNQQLPIKLWTIHYWRPVFLEEKELDI